MIGSRLSACKDKSRQKMERGKEGGKERKVHIKFQSPVATVAQKTQATSSKPVRQVFFLLNKWNTKLGSFPITNAGPISTSPHTILLLDFLSVWHRWLAGPTRAEWRKQNYSK
jgi:hypothetical protein